MLFNEFGQLAIGYCLLKGGHCGILSYYEHSRISKINGIKAVSNCGGIFVFQFRCFI
jgi:hypothetical protein